ncbi:type II toxin-antitoxin system VapC family toxin [Mesorhizobium sp. KR2-14]|uniref:type II toxin-antitoxin system VapC family toxin n=1 Tax=Mesorhizobium sp. KR2-14 TaxID=3156610 RepID=UPI0032B6250C
MIVLDTNVISALMRPAVNPEVVSWLDRESSSAIWITAISVLEIRSGLLLLPDGRRKSDLLERFDLFLDDAIAGRVLPFDRNAAEAASSLSARRIAIGRNIDALDTQIAGVAISRRAALATRNVKDFNDIDVPLINPWPD